ncbi:TldD/PmbA family protein [Gloeocapsa sp. PCC 73106]|uniref:TldD/PmbA family protein n=1 Tax=Gloeocapsa sp. PCC 73106 TaxID=102232 RepID=UPI0002ACED6B|nr:TldD/PmbA family protein [Gloeocapsa sp. PCC 73106]ELR99850.1 putative Zn-dependent protease-like protein [Gloeocapsa sp. PCC 73106]
MSNCEPEQILELAQKSGASEAEVYQVSAQSQPVYFEGNRLKQVETSESFGYALRLWKEGRPGLAVAYGKVDAEILIEKALALSKLNPPETPELVTQRREIHPPQGKLIPCETLVNMGREAIALLRQKYPETICVAELESELETTTLVNSKGLYCQYSTIENSCLLGIEWIRGEDFLAIYDGEEKEQELDLFEIIDKISRRLEWAKTNVEPYSGKQPVLFTPDAGGLLWGSVSAALNSKRVLEKSSPWSEKLGEIVVSPMLTFAQLVHGVTCPFDDEGTPTQDLALIEKGILKGFYSDRTRAKALNQDSTGNGFRPSLGHYPTPELVNLSLEPGSAGFSDLIAQIEDGIIVDQILGGGPDISGDFSINLDLGYRVHRGEIIGRVKDTMVAGNVYDVLKQVIALGNDINPDDFYRTPSVLVEGLSVVS